MSLRKIVSLLLAISSAIFLQRYLSPEAGRTPFLFSDSVGYYLEARRIYLHPSLTTLAATDRPLFCWWIPLIASWLHIPLGLNALVFLNELASVALLVCGLWLCFRDLKHGELPVAWCAGITLAGFGAIHFDHVHSLMGDLYLAGYAVFAEGVLLEFERSSFRDRRWGVGAGITFALGAQTKPIFLFWALPRLFFSALLWGLKKREGRAIPYFAAPLAVTLFLVAPRGLPGFIRLQYFHNEVWKFFGGESDLGWFIRDFWTFFTAAAPASLLLVLSAVVACKKLNASAFKRPDFLALAFCFAYLTMRVSSKDLRTTFILFALTLAWAARVAAEKLAPRCWRRSAALASLGLVLVSWQAWRWDWRMTTFEELGYDRLIGVLAREPGSHYAHRAFLAVSDPKFNDSSFYASQIGSCGLPGKSDEVTCSNLPLFRADSAFFRFGAWGYPGGFPQGFFSDSFVVLRSEYMPGNLSKGIELYNQLLQRKLLAGDRDFSDGLREIARPSDLHSGSWIVLRRMRAPSKAAFMAQMREIFSRDPDNIWNEPWRAAYLRLLDPKFDPFSPSEIERRERMTASNTYDLELNPWGLYVKRFLAGEKSAIVDATFEKLAAGP